MSKKTKKRRKAYQKAKNIVKNNLRKELSAGQRVSKEGAINFLKGYNQFK